MVISGRSAFIFKGKFLSQSKEMLGGGGYSTKQLCFHVQRKRAIQNSCAFMFKGNGLFKTVVLSCSKEMGYSKQLCFYVQRKRAIQNSCAFMFKGNGLFKTVVLSCSKETGYSEQLCFHVQRKQALQNSCAFMLKRLLKTAVLSC